MNGDYGVHRLDGHDAFDAEIDDKGFERREVFADGLVECDEAGGEIGGFDQRRGGIGAIGVWRLAIADGAEVDSVESLAGVELARTAIVAQTVVVVDAIGAVGRLLYLGEQDAFAYGMDASARDEENIASGRMLYVQ